MISELLTIVIPTRDRPAFLERCLRSVFIPQTELPRVIVSDNSISDHPAIKQLRDKYEFTYVRQSGELTNCAHLNICCLEIPATPWVLLLHDDDQLCPDATVKLASFLEQYEHVGIVVAGIEHINEHDKVIREWLPKMHGAFRGEDGMLRLGLDAGACPPGTIYNVAASRQIRGFVGINGVASDYSFGLQLAYAHGVAFLPELVGRYRCWPQNIYSVSNGGQEAWLDFTLGMAELVRTIGCSAAVADEIIDYLVWWVFLTAAPYSSHSYRSLSRMCDKGLRVSPRAGIWQTRARKEYPLLFWRPQWLVWPIYKVAKTVLPAPLRRELRKVVSNNA